MPLHVGAQGGGPLLCGHEVGSTGFRPTENVAPNVVPMRAMCVIDEADVREGMGASAPMNHKTALVRGSLRLPAIKLARGGARMKRNKVADAEKRDQANNDEQHQ